MKATVLSCVQSKSKKSYIVAYKTDKGEFEGLSKEDLSGYEGKTIEFNLNKSTHDGKDYYWINDVVAEKQDSGQPYGKPISYEIELLRIKSMLFSYAKDFAVAQLPANQTITMDDICKYYQQMVKAIELIPEEETYREPY